jgi:AsmA protein
VISSRIQRVTAGAIVTASVLGIALLALPYLVSEQQIRGAASRSIQAATGLVPRIDGPVRLALLPRPAIQVQEIYLDDGTKSGPAVGALQASLQFWPLLFGEIKVATLTLDRLRLAIEFSADGKLVGGLPINPAIADNEDVPELRVANGSILFRVQGRDHVHIISRVDASLNWSGASLTATGSFLLGNKPTNASLVIADTAALAKGQRSGLRFRIESEPARLGYEGGITFRESTLQGEGSISADGRSLREALALFGATPPSPTGFGRFSAKAAVTLTPIALAFSNLALELDDNRATGGLTWKRDANRSILQGALASEVTDLSIYQSPIQLTSGNGREWTRQPLDTTTLENFDVDLRLSCGKLVVGRVEIGKAAIALGVKNRLFTLAIGEAQFYGGTLRGNANWNAADEIPSLRLDANLGNFDLERGLGGLTGFRRLEGKGSLTVAVTSKGKSVHELASAIDGKVQLAMKQGALAGINAEAVLRRLERRPLSGTGDLRGGRTPFDRLNGNLDINNGTAVLTGFDIESPILRISLQGESSIVLRDLDLRGTASLVRAAQSGSTQVAFELPFLISGTWDNPYLLPDPDALIRHSGATAPLLDAVRGRAAREAMRSVIETVTGLRSIGEFPANPTFEPPAITPPSLAPIYAPAPQPTQSR